MIYRFHSVPLVELREVDSNVLGSRIPIEPEAVPGGQVHEFNCPATALLREPAWAAISVFVLSLATFLGVATLWEGRTFLIGAGRGTWLFGACVAWGLAQASFWWCLQSELKLRLVMTALKDRGGEWCPLQIVYQTAPHQAEPLGTAVPTAESRELSANPRIFLVRGKVNAH